MFTFIESSVYELSVHLFNGFLFFNTYPVKFTLLDAKGLELVLVHPFDILINIFVSEIYFLHYSLLKK